MKKTPLSPSGSTPRDMIREILGIPTEQWRKRALAALHHKRFDLVDRLLETEDIELGTLLEDLRIYQVELEIQNDELLGSQRQTQEALARFTSLFHGLPIAGLVIDRQGLVKETNGTAQTLFTLERSHLRHHYFARLVAESDRATVIEAWTRLATHQPLQLTEIRFNNGQPGGFIGDLHLAPLPESPDAPAQFVCVVIDRTEAIRQRLALLETSDRLRQSEIDLTARLKALAALHDVLAETGRVDQPIRQTLQRVVERLPTAWRFPELAEARIQLPEARVATPDFRATRWTLSTPIALAAEQAGTLQIAYREQPPATGDSTFLAEEQSLLEAIAAHVAVFLARHRDEEQLRESRENYRILAEYSPDWEYWLGPEGEYRYVSPGCATVTGYAAESFITDPSLMRRLIHPADLDTWIRHTEARETREKADATCLEIRIRGRDGQERWIEHICTPVIGPDGRYLGQRGVNRDVTGRKRAEARATRLANLYSTLSHCRRAIVRCQDQYSLLHEICRIAVTFGGIQVCAITLSAPGTDDPMLVAVEGLGQRTAEILVTVTANIDTDRVSEVFPNIPRYPLLNGRVPTHGTSDDLALLERAGLRSAAIHPLCQGGRPIGAIYFYDSDAAFFAPDITELLEQMSADVSFALAAIAQEHARRAAETAVAERERYLSAIFRAAQVGIGVSVQGIIREVNQYLCELLGYRREELIGLATQHLYCDEDVYQIVGRLIHTQDDLAETRTLETQWQRQDGMRLDVLLTTAPLDDEYPERGLVFTVLNMTERKGFEEALQRSQDFLNATGRLARVGGWEFHQASRRLSCTPVTHEILETPPGRSLSAREVLRHIHPHDRPKLTAANAQALATGQPYDIQIRLTQDGGRELWTQLTCQPVSHDGQVVKLMGAIQDITARVEAEKSLRQAARVFESTAEGVIITDPDERILAVNRAFTEITGYREEEILGKTPRILKSGRHDTLFYQTLWSELKRIGLWRGEIWNRHKSGAIYPELMTISAVLDDANEPTHYVGVFRDISHIKRSETQLAFLAHHDPLTGLPNRSLFQERLEHCLQRARRHGGQIGLLFIDLDRFKHVNDTLGHTVGDNLLKTVAETLAAQVRSADTIARLGGDEFVVVLEDIPSPEDSLAFARRILSIFDRPFKICKHEIFVTASIGISLYPRDGEDLDTLLRHADIAMYRAKALGRNAFIPFDPTMVEGAADRFRLENELRGALQRQELLLHYQPQVGLEDGRLYGAEALCRWRHPTLGLVPPDTFIPLAEDIGVIDTLGAWVLAEGCRQLAVWDRLGIRIPRLAINLSMHQLEGGSLVGQIRDLLATHDIAPERIELEVTESMIMRRPEQAITALEELRALGVTIAVDDFGTGYSSLAYLKRLPLNRLKIHRSFVEHLTQDPNDDAIVRAIIGLGLSLGLETLAEGVETTEQADFLHRQGCREVQGYLFSRPLPAPDLAATWANKTEERD